MAPLYKTAAAVCLVAFSGLQSAEAATTVTYKFTPVVVNDAGYLAAKLARNGKLPVRINEVEKSESIVTSLEEKEGIFHYTFENQENPNYRVLLQKALDNGLTVFKDNKDKKNWVTIWDNDAAASLAYLLAANSTEIGCVIGECTTSTNTENGRQAPIESKTGKAVLFCELNPAAQKGKAAFDDEYYDGLIARTTKLEEMTEEDLKANDSTAAAAVPTVLAAGLVALLTVFFA